MSRSAPVLLWASWVGVLAVVLWFWTHDPLLPALLSGAAVAALAVGAYAARPAPSARARRLPDISVPTVMVTIAVALMLLGLAFGLWVVLLGAWVLAAGLLGLVRELAGQRRGTP